MTAYKIIFDDKNDNKNAEKRAYKIRALLKRREDLAKVLLSTYHLKIPTLSELYEFFVKHFKPCDRAYLYKLLKTLEIHGLIERINIKDAIYLSEMDNNPKNSLYKEIVRKYREWIIKIPPQFQERFRDVYYYYVTKFGEEFLEWCGEVTGIKVVKEDA